MAKTRVIERCVHGGGSIRHCKQCKKKYDNKKKWTPIYLLQLARARARKKKLPFSISVDDLRASSACPILGIPMDGRSRDYVPTVDEIVQGLGYVPNNVAVISGRANRIKSDASLLEIQAIEAYMRIRGKIARNGIPDSW